MAGPLSYRLKWVWVKIKPPGDRRCWSMFPLARVPFGVPIFDPQPNQRSSWRSTKHRLAQAAEPHSQHTYSDPAWLTLVSERKWTSYKCGGPIISIGVPFWSAWCTWRCQLCSTHLPAPSILPKDPQAYLSFPKWKLVSCGFPSNRHKNGAPSKKVTTRPSTPKAVAPFHSTGCGTSVASASARRVQWASGSASSDTGRCHQMVSSWAKVPCLTSWACVNIPRIHEIHVAPPTKPWCLIRFPGKSQLTMSSPWFQSGVKRISRPSTVRQPNQLQVSFWFP